MEISGYVVLGIVTLLFLYLMPQLIRSRQDVVDSRVDDRFSADLRILATAGKAGSPTRPAPDDGASRAYLHHPHLRTGVPEMNRPPAPASRTVAAVAGPAPRVEAPVERAVAPARAEAIRRRRAAARRRLVLTVALLAASVGAWAAVALGAAQPVGAVVPTVLFGAVLVLGRRAAIAGRRAQQRTAPVATPAVVEPAAPARAEVVRELPAARRIPVAGGPEREARTEIIPRVEDVPGLSGLRWQGQPTEVLVDEVAEDRSPIVSTSSVPAAREVADGSWTPVPVPVPTYTLKPAAPRLDAAPLVIEEPVVEATAGSEGRPLDLDEVLNRRRAAGE